MSVWNRAWYGVACCGIWDGASGGDSRVYESERCVCVCACLARLLAINTWPLLPLIKSGTHHVYCAFCATFRSCLSPSILHTLTACPRLPCPIAALSLHPHYHRLDLTHNTQHTHMPPPPPPLLLGAPTDDERTPCCSRCSKSSGTTATARSCTGRWELCYVFN